MTSSNASAYEQLLRELKEISLLGSTMSVLGWDEQTYMPHGGACHRAEQVSLLARLAHERTTSDKFQQLLAAAEQEPGDTLPHGDRATNLRQVRRYADRAMKLPASLVEELSHTSVMSEQAWAGARKINRYEDFQPWLEKMISLKRTVAQCVGSQSGELYDALLDEYEPGMTAARLRVIFDELRQALVPLVEQSTQSAHQPQVALLHRHYPHAGQDKLSRAAAAAFGFNFEQGRLDVSAHPFCSFIGPGDTRMTTRFDENDVANAFFSVLHETGHGLYDQGLPAEHFGTPCGDYVSLGIHESQSRLWENLVGRSESFWQWMWPRFQREFPAALDGVSGEDWLAAINAVQPSLIRTESDEVTYNLHIILRFQLEQALLNGDLQPADLPAAWNEAMQDMLGVRPATNSDGCMQDIHWSGGGFGYFPTYTLGNLISAQLFEAAQRDIPDMLAGFATGDFAPLLQWLRNNIHVHGQRYTSAQLVEKATGAELSAQPLLRHLSAKVSRFYS